MTQERLAQAIAEEGKKFEKCYLWLEKEMPEEFFKETSQDNLLLITHGLMGFEMQDYYTTIHLKGAAIVLSLDLPDADLRILRHYVTRGIKNYQTFVSKSPFHEQRLKVVSILFTEAETTQEETLSEEARDSIYEIILKEYPQITREEFHHLLQDIGGVFLTTLTHENAASAISMYFRSKTRDSCQHVVHQNPGWKENGAPSLQIIMAWKNTPIYQFLFRLARIIYRHKLVIRHLDATHVHPYQRESTLILILDLHGQDGKGVEESANTLEFLRELITVKYFASFDLFDTHLVSKELISGNFANVLRAIQIFVHQALVHLDPNLYTMDNIAEGLTRHPDLTIMLAEAFKLKFHPTFHDLNRYLFVRENYQKLVSNLDTGQEEYDLRRKNILFQAMNMVHHTLKTNAYRKNFTALSFRLDPRYLEELPFDRSKKFPDIPFAIFFIKGMHFFGFHIRFKDLARGGLRTVAIKEKERMWLEQNNVFTECYHLALTQHLKNKDIPEGGAKGIIFLKPFERLDVDTDAYIKELLNQNKSIDKIDDQASKFREEQSLEHLYQAQRAFVENLMLLVNCNPNGQLKAHGIIDYWAKPEYLYLGPDENMHDGMIEWIADLSKKYRYRPGTSFITSKPKSGINHKEFGVTSLGINVYLVEFLRYIGIEPERDIFTVKMVGGPDGDVAGNQILNLRRYYPKTAKLISLTDISGTIYDPEGLDLDELAELFKFGKPICHYPPEKLNSGGFLVNKSIKKDISLTTQHTACYRKQDGKLIQDWISGSEMNLLLRDNVHKTRADVFIPAGGRPRSLNESNYKEFLTETGKATARIIIEGANLYLTAGARREIEKQGTLIIRDSSANKTGVICSSFEVLAGLTLGDEVFYENKDTLIKEILARLEKVAHQEACALIREHKETGSFLSEISAKISERINFFTYQILDYLETIDLPSDPKSPLIQTYLSYCLPFLQHHHQEALLSEIPDLHKKAIIACHLSCQLVYQRGLHWFPSILDILPVLLKENKS